MKRHKPELLKEPIKRNQVWSVDFMHDQLSNGRKIRLFNVIHDFKREGLVIDAGYSFPTIRVIRSLNLLIKWQGQPSVVRCNNSSEFISHEFTHWANYMEFESNIFNQATHNKTLPSNDITRH